MRRKRKESNVISEPKSKTLNDFETVLLFNWYRVNYNEKDAKRFLAEFTSCKIKKSIINNLSYVPLSHCWIARMVKNGNIVPKKCLENVEKYINSLEKETKIPQKNNLFKVSAEEKNKNKTLDAYSYLENLIDKLFDSKGKVEVKSEPVITMYNLNKSQASLIADYIENDHLKDLRDISTDTEIQEGYSFLTKRQQNLIYKNLKNLKDEFLSVRNVVDKERKRKVRAVRIKPIEERISKLKFRKSVFKIDQIDMKHLIGKRVLYVASEDKRTLIRMESKSGFDTRSSFLINVDSAERFVIYGTNLEKGVEYISKAKNEKLAKKINKHIIVRRKEQIEIKNNEYRSTDKFCVIQGYLDL